MKLISYSDRTEQAKQLADLVATELKAALVSKDGATAAFAGGTTPVLFFQALAQEPVAWAKVAFTLTDERQVSPENERSNALLLEQNFLSRLNAKPKFQPLYQANQNSADLPALAAVLQRDYLPLDVVVLGMGNDGHFASLFPQAPNLAAGLDPNNSAVLLEVSAPDLPEARISFTLAALLSAKHLHLLITGVEKKQLLTQAQERVTAKQAPQWPIEALLQQAGDSLTVHYAP